MKAGYTPTGEELLEELHADNAAILADHMTETVMELMDRAAVAAHKKGADLMASMVTTELTLIKAKQ